MVLGNNTQSLRDSIVAEVREQQQPVLDAAAKVNDLVPRVDSAEATAAAAQATAGAAQATAAVAQSAAGTAQTAVARVDPGTTAPAVGHALRQGPSGPAWGERVISADWYSNPNDALTAAGVGGTVRFSALTYTLPEPLRVLPRQTIEGMGGRATVLKVGGASQVIGVGNPAAECDWVTIRNLGIDGNLTTGIGLDARGMTRGFFSNLRIVNVATTNVAFGGNMPQFQSGWTNTFVKGELIVPANGRGVLMTGWTDGGTGARCANNITVMDTIMNLTPDATSVGVEIEAGDSNRIIGCDLGYSVGDGLPVLLKSGARGNRFIGNRTEETYRAVRIDGGQENYFAGNWWATSPHATFYPVEITGAPSVAAPNIFIGNAYTYNARKPYVWEAGTYGTVILEDGQIKLSAGSGDPNALEILDEATAKSFILARTGSMYWPTPTSSSFTGSQLLMESGTTGALRWGDGSIVRLPRHSPLPSATASRRGAMVIVEGAAGVKDQVLVCVKTATDSYIWHPLY